MQAKFCPSCGAPLQGAQRFCGSCGQAVPAPQPTAQQAAPQPVQAVQQPVAPPQPAQPAPAAAPQEAILGIVPQAEKRSGFMGLKRDNYSIVITPYRLVFAYISKEVQNNALRQANASAKAEGKGFLGVAAAQMRWLDIVLQQLEETPVDAIFQRFPGSFQIDNRVIQRIRFRQTSTEEDTRVVHLMQIDTTGGKLKYYISGHKNTVAKLLRQALPHAVK